MDRREANHLALMLDALDGVPLSTVSGRAGPSWQVRLGRMKLA